MASNKVKGTPRMVDVAQAAGVSVPTASLVLSGKGERYSRDTQKRVKASAENLGWRPNALIKGIQSGKSNMIGVLVPPYDSYYTKILAGIHMELAANDYVPITLWIGQNEENFFHSEKATDDGLQQIHRLIDRRVEGFILWPVIADTYARHFKEWLDRELPAVVIDAELPGGVGDTVETDEAQGGGLVAEHLASRGHRRVVVLSRKTQNLDDWSGQRTSAAVSGLEERGVEVRVCKPEDHPDAIYASCVEILEGDYKPTAVFCITDAMAAIFYSVALEKGVSIPEDISVMGYADLLKTSELRPGLTTIRQQPLEIGRAAARLLVGRINGTVSVERQVLRFGCELVERGSIAQV